MFVKGLIDFSLLDWPGRAASVAFLPGCNFRCPFCHNHNLVLQPDALEDIPLEKVLEPAKKHRGWIEGLVVSGGEPTIHAWFPDFLAEIKREKLAVKLDTNGSRPGMLERLMKDDLVDHIAMDIKAPLEDDLYQRLSGVPVDLDDIRRSVEMIISSGLEYTFRTTVVPPWLGEIEILRIAGYLKAGRKYILQNFDPRDTLDPSCKTRAPLTEEDFQNLCHKAGQVMGAEKFDPADRQAY